jgi:hypothetical protein
MKTVVNNPGGGTSSESSGVGLILGVIVAIVLIGLFFVYGLPALQGTPSPAAQTGGTNVNVTLPNTGTGTSGTSGGTAAPAPSGGFTY